MKRLIVAIIGVSFLLSGCSAIYMKTIGKASEKGAMDKVRKERTATYQKKGQELDMQTRKANKALVDAFVESDKSYRMHAVIQYAYDDGVSPRRLRTDMDVAYNHKKDIYRFTLYTTGDVERERFNGLWVDNGTYYVVEENGKTYVLSEVYGKKFVTEADEENPLLRYFFTVATLNTTFLESEYARGYNLWENAGYYDVNLGVQMQVFKASPGRIFITWKNKPVRSVLTTSSNSGMDRQFHLDYYYNKIPGKAPSVRGWK